MLHVVDIKNTLHQSTKISGYLFISSPTNNMAGRTKVKRSSTNNRKEPLLPQTQQNVESSKSRCGACGRFMLHIIPMIGGIFVIGSLFLLTIKLGVPITDTSISRCLADYTPKVEVLILIFIGATLMFISTMMRNIQINVYHRRQKSESKCMRMLNLIAAISNILAYVGFALLAIYDLDGPGNAPTIHYIGAYMYFSLSSVYGILHTFLLCKQTQYPMAAKMVFTLLPLVSIACTLIYVIKINDEDCPYEYEWLSVALHALTVGMMSVLFCIDSVDDELRDFFCCRRGKNSGVERRRSSQGGRRKDIELT